MSDNLALFNLRERNVALFKQNRQWPSGIGYGYHVLLTE